MTEHSALEYINDNRWNCCTPGLERIRELLHLMGNPQDRLKFIHVAGTNGKGSTCAMLAAILQAAGYRTGLFTSPHLISFHERFRVNGQDISGERLASVVGAIAPLADSMADHPSQFELSTAIAMEYFSQEECDIVVLETGLGGELDSTNAIDCPELAVITNIGLDHTEILGNSLEEIATAKAGIIKSEGDVVCYYSSAEAVKVIVDRCENMDAKLSIADFEALRPINTSLSMQSFSWKSYEGLELSLLGAHQLKNAVMVLECVDILRGKGWVISDLTVRTGLKNVDWPARFELAGTAPLFILDGSHNPQCFEALAENIRTFLSEKEITFLVGALADKDYVSMMSKLVPFAKSFVCVTPDSPRALSADSLVQTLTGLGCSARSCGSIAEAVSLAKKLASPDGAVVCCGSLYMMGELKAVNNA